MKSTKRFLILFALGVLNLGLLVTTFSALTHQSVFERTLGKLTDNYVRSDDDNGMVVKKENVAFNQLEENKLITWDAAIYKAISERMYISEESNYGVVRGALFPLFPMLWKV